MLATVNTVDFLYTCHGHLSDSGFATVVQEDSKPLAAVSVEEITKVKAGWEERQKRKQEKEKEPEKEEKKKEKEDTESQTKKGSKPPNLPGSQSVSPSPSPKPTHDRYILHRDYFAS